MSENVIKRVAADERSAETRAEEIARLQREIAQRQMRLQQLVLGDPSKGVTVEHRT